MNLQPIPLLRIIKPIALLALTIIVTSLLSSLLPSYHTSPNPNTKMAARSYVLWLHGLGDSGPANEPMKNLFTSPQFINTKWLFPSAPRSPVTCNDGAIMPSWFDILEIPVTAKSPKDEKSVLEAVQKVHAIIDKEVASGIDPENIFICGFSQGGALTLASVLLYPTKLGGGAIFSGWLPFKSYSIVEKISQEAKKTPILWSHGIDDRIVLFESGQAAVSFLKQIDMNCELKSYPGLGHSINNEELKSLESWIKAHFKGSS